MTEIGAGICRGYGKSMPLAGKMERTVCWAILAGLLGVVLLATASCASKKAIPADKTVGEQPGVEALRKEYEAKLDRVVRRHVEAETDKKAGRQKRLVKKKPYYLREYVVYPEIPDDLNIQLHETESRSRPYYADVQLPKVRYSTRMHRKRKEARKDDTFLRDVGEVTLTFELRNGRWQRVGSMFIADTSEENVNGEWVPREVEIERTIPSEEQQSWIVRKFKKLIRRKEEK